MSKTVYRQRKPQESPYYQCVEDYFETFEQVYDDRFPRQYGFLRPYVKQVIYRYLDCGILQNKIEATYGAVPTQAYWWVEWRLTGDNGFEYGRGASDHVEILNWPQN